MPKEKKETKLIPIRVWMFFGCSLLMFCIAIYQAVLRPTLASDPQISANLPSDDTPSNTSGEISISSSSWETPSSLRESETTEAIQSITSNQPSPITVIEEATTWPQFLHQWYQIFSSKDVTLLRTLMEPAMQKNETIRQFWTEYKITPFIDNIEGHKLEPQNITLLSTSPSGAEEYQYELNYTLLPDYDSQNFQETRIAKIKYTESWPKLASIRCETHRCSYNPFFRPESYGLVK